MLTQIEKNHNGQIEYEEAEEVVEEVVTVIGLGGWGKGSPVQ